MSVQHLIEILKRTPSRPYPYDHLRWLLGSDVAPAAYDGEPERTLKELHLTHLHGGRLQLETPTPYDHERVAAGMQWAVCVCQSGATVDGRVFHPLLLAYAARHQIRNCPVFDDHAHHARLASEYLAFLDEGYYEQSTGRLLARLNVKRPALQRRLMDLSARERLHEVCFSLMLKPYARERPGSGAFEMTLAYQLQSVDVVPVPGCPAAHVLGLWTDRDALLRADAAK